MKIFINSEGKIDRERNSYELLSCRKQTFLSSWNSFWQKRTAALERFVRESQTVWTLCLFSWIRRYCSASENARLSSFSTNLRHFVCNVLWVIRTVVATNLLKWKWERENVRVSDCEGDIEWLQTAKYAV